MRLLNKLLMGLSLSLLLVQCSLRETAFKRSDWLAQWTAGRYFDPEAERKAEMRTTVDQLMATFRQQYAVQLTSRLAQFSDLLAQPRTMAEWQTFYDSLETLRKDTLLATLQISAPFLYHIEEPEIAHLEKRLSKSNEEIEELATSKKYDSMQTKSLKKYFEVLDELFDDLTPAQQDLVTQHFSQPQEQVVTYLQGRSEVQKLFVQQLREAKSAAAIVTAFTPWIENPDVIPSRSYQLARKARARRHLNFTVAFDPTLSKEQRAHARKVIASLKQEVTEAFLASS